LSSEGSLSHGLDRLASGRQYFSKESFDIAASYQASYGLAATIKLIGKNKADGPA
jgi:hypothetical protein